MGEMVRYGILPNPYTPGVLVDFYGNPITSGGGSGFPIADPTGSSNAVQTPDPLTGTDTLTWVKFPTQQGALAWGITGETYPRVVIDSVGDIYWGDGTFDATTGEVQILAQFPDSIRSIKNLALFASDGGGPQLGHLRWSGVGSAVSGIGQENGDVIMHQGSSDSAHVLEVWAEEWIGGYGLSRIWASTDPVTQGYVPTQAGILWQYSNGSTLGELWISTGTSGGDWARLDSGSDTGWINLSLVNSWTAAGNARYRRLNGVTYIELNVGGGSAATIATLPATFRPGFEAGMAAVVENSAVFSAGSLFVTAAGDINVANFDGSTPSSLVAAGYSFPADA